MLARSREEQRDIQIIERDLTSDLANQFNQRIDLEGMFLPCAGFNRWAAPST